MRLISLSPENQQEACELLLEFAQHPLEIRLDHQDWSPDFSGLRAIHNGFLVFTPRIGDQKSRILLAEKAIDSGFSAVDLDISDCNFGSPSLSQRLIASMHPSGFPEDSVLKALNQIDSRWKKIAVPVGDATEALELIQKSRQSIPSPLIISAMGKAGQFLRLAPGIFGSEWSYLCPEEKPTAEGQLSLQDLKKLGLEQEPQEDAEIFGLMGWKIQHSRSPLIHNHWFQSRNLNACYLPFETRYPKRLLELLPESRGFSVTSPLKETLGKLFQTDSPINTLFRRNDNWQTEMTDGKGLTLALHHKFPDWQKTPGVLITGLGGLGQHVLTTLLESGVAANKILLWNRTHSKAEILAEKYGVRALESLENFQDPILWIQCSQPAEWISRFLVSIDPGRIAGIADSNYGSGREELSRWARNRKIPLVDGQDWLAAQALFQQKYFTGHCQDFETVRELIL